MFSLILVFIDALMLQAAALRNKNERVKAGVVPANRGYGPETLGWENLTAMR